MRVRSLEDLVHSILSHQYSPEEAHLYYLRTRQLKGRQPGKGPDATTPRSTGTAKPPPGKKVGQEPPPIRKKVDPKAAEKKRKETEAKIQALQGRLETLRKVLAQLVEQAKARSGVETKTPPKASDKTTAERKAAADASKKYYEKHKNDPQTQTPDEQVKQLETKIKAVQAKIKEMRDKLKLPVKPQHPTRKTDSAGVVTTKR
jgi:hypothetical protein